MKGKADLKVVMDTSQIKIWLDKIPSLELCAFDGTMIVGDESSH